MNATVVAVMDTRGMLCISKKLDVCTEIRATSLARRLVEASQRMQAISQMRIQVYGLGLGCDRDLVYLQNVKQ